MRTAVLLLSSLLVTPALAQVPQPGMGGQGPSRPAAIGAPAPVPNLPPPATQGGAPAPVPERIAPPGSGGTAGPANSTPFSGPPSQTLPPAGGRGQDAAVPKLSR